MKDAIFQINKPATLQRIISLIDELPTEDNDTKGIFMNTYFLNLLSQVQMDSLERHVNYRNDG